MKEKKEEEMKETKEMKEEQRKGYRAETLIDYSYLKQLARLGVQLIGPAVLIPSHSASL
jgi:hypothetical protein